MKKKFLLFASMLICMLFVSQGMQANGDSYWYAKLTVTTNPESGAGLVYADRYKIWEEDAPGTYTADSFIGTGRATSSGGDGKFFAYAKPNRGYLFDHWNNAGDESVRTDSIEVVRTVYSGDDGKDKETVYTEYNDLVAYFVVNPPLSGGVTFNAADGGTYTVDYELLETAEDPAVPTSSFLTYNTDVITLTATSASGCNFKGWKKNGTIVSYANPWQTSFDAAATIEPVFETGQPNFKVDGITFATLDEAITFAQSEACTAPVVVVNQNCTIPAGDYTIPSGVTLLVPFNADNQVNEEPSVVTSGTPSRSVFRTLTLANGANLTVNGSICVNAIMCLTMGYNGSAMNGYGLIDMKAGSTVTMKNGSNFYVWGFVIGDGSVIAESGSTIHETFQFKHRGGNALSSIASYNADKKVFPINQYYIQSIEAPITFKKGATEKVYTGVHNVAEAISIDFIGTSGLFKMTGTDAYLIKKYDVSKDRQNYTLYGDATIGSIKFGMSGFYKESKDFVLPITNNMTLNVESGTTTIQYETAILPDVEVNIASAAKIISSSNNCYVYDSLNWKGAYAYANDYSKAEAAQIAPVVYRHGGLQYNRKKYRLRPATINVNGTLEGKIYTTEGGANITSTDHGTFIPAEGMSESVTTYQAGQDGTSGKFDAYVVIPAKLRNADGTYTPTANNNLTNTFEYQDGKWLAIVPENTAVEDGKELVVNYEEQLETIDTLQVSNGGTVTIAAAVVETPVVVETGGTVNVPKPEDEASKPTIKLCLNSCPADIQKEEGENDNVTAGQSSQVEGGENIDPNSDIYLDIKMHPSGNMNSLLWYTFAVPFNVAIEDGVEKVDKNGNATTAVLDTDYRCYTYDGSKRAEGDLTNAWVQVISSTDGGYFVPGKFYLVEFNSNAYNTFRFHKATGEAVNNAQNLTLTAYESTTGDGTDGGWNAIANTALKGAKITISEGAAVAQIYNPVNRKFESVVLSETTLALGAALFVQVGETTTANNSAVSTTPSSVVARRQAKDDAQTYGLYQLRIGQPEKAYEDQLIFSATTKEKHAYKAGKDLTKMFMGNSTVAQMWINDYNSKLTANEMPMNNGRANASLTIYAPKADEYELRLKSVPEDATIYLTKNGKVIWNLSMANCMVSLNQGENAGYGIRIVANAPQVTTGVEEAIADTQDNDIRKVLVDGHVFIIRGHKAYTVEGQTVK